MTEQSTQDKKGFGFYSIMTAYSIYLTAYSIGALWLLIDGLTNKFSSLNNLWDIGTDGSFSTSVILLLFTIFGAVLGGSVLNIISFHKYFSVENSFGIKFFWGFFFTPLLSAIIGFIAFALVQGGLLVLSGPIGDQTNTMSSKLGFVAIGCIAGFNWDTFASKLQELSSVFKQDSKNTKNSDEPKEPAPETL